MPTSTPSVSINTIQINLDADRRWRERRHQAWTDSYELYRNTVITNRLTQRQSVNVPWMKETIRLLLSKSGEAADMDFEDLANDGRKSILMQAYWEKCAEESKYELLDVVDKKNVGLYGRGHTRLNIVNGMIRFTVHDPFDVLVDRYCLPWDLESARRVTLVGMYRTLSELELNPIYSKEAITRLRTFFATKQGLITAGQNSLIVADRAQRMQDMGVPDVQNPLLGETYVELNECQMKVWHPEEGKDLIHVVVTANGTEILMDRLLRDILGVNFFTWTTWGDDPEATDYWIDGAGDIVRIPNQIANAYYAQMVEMGILRGYGMNFYNAKAQEGWSPVGYVPSPWGFYPLPGEPDKVLKHIEIPEMQSHMEEINWMKQMVETATAATATEKGDADNSAKTLGELQMMAAKAEDRLKDIPKFARIHAVQLGDKFAKLVEANAAKLKPVTLYKKGASGDYYPYELKPSELKSKEGYKCKATLKTEKEADALKGIQKLKIMSEQFPMNAPLQKILKQRMLSWGDLNPEEKREVMDFEDQMPAMPGMPGAPGAAPNGPAPITGAPMLPPGRPMPLPAHA